MAEQSRFNSVAIQYAAGRPNYPAALFDALSADLGRPLDGIDALDLGAGTGIASRQLAERGARVTALELSGPMLAQLVAESPGVQAVQGSVHALPFRDDTADLITCAQAWHWINPEIGVPEVRRVLRPGGIFAAWWNYTHRDSTWEAEQEERIARAVPNWAEYQTSTNSHKDFDTEGGFGLVVTRHEFNWERDIPVERHLQNLNSKSYIAALPDPAAFLAVERELLLDVFPSGVVTERFGTKLVTAREP
jgi:SAM-dependent methyltransferase